MISNHLSMVEALRPASNELAHNIEAFLSKGGTIQVLEESVFIPRVRHEPPPSEKKAKPIVRRRVEPVPMPADPIDARRDRSAEKAEMVRAMAETHTQTKVSAKTGMTLRTLRELASDFGFSFKRATHGGHYGDDWKAEMKSRNECHAERIRAFKELGLSRRRVSVILAISYTTLAGILAEYGIDYPKARKGKIAKPE